MTGVLSEGLPHPLGATWDGLGVNFALFSANATKVELCLFDEKGEREVERIELPEYTDEIWHGYVRDAAASLFIICYVPLLGSFTALMLAGENGGARLVTFILVVVMSDTGGYVFGVLMGKHPMAPKISPKKSWEGFAGSLVFGVVAGICMAVLGLQVPIWIGILIGVALVAVGTCGDLIESMIKRDLGIKDMSSFLPGHGGVMDRLDSLLVAAPVAWLIMYILVPGG